MTTATEEMANQYTYDDSDDYDRDRDGLALDSEESVYSPKNRHLPTLDAMLRCCKETVSLASTGGDDADQVQLKTRMFEMLVDYADQWLDYDDDTIDAWIGLMSEMQFPRSIVRAALLQRQAKQPTKDDLEDIEDAIVAMTD